MDFSLSKQEQLFLQMIREFAEKEVKPLAAEVDESERFPMETVQKMAKLGIMGIPFPVELGGAGGSNILYTMAVEELSRVCATTGVIVCLLYTSGCHDYVEVRFRTFPDRVQVVFLLGTAVADPFDTCVNVRFQCGFNLICRVNG